MSCVGPLSTIKWLLRSAKKRLRKILNPVGDRIEDQADSGGRKKKEPEV